MRNPIAALIAACILSVAGCTPAPSSAPAQDVPAPDAAPAGKVQIAETAIEQPPSAPPTEPVIGGLSFVLDSANIGRRLDIFERRVGTPLDAGKDWASYKVESCTVRVQTEDNIISWIELSVGANDCRVDLKPLVGTSRVVSKASPLTFGEFDTLSSKNTFYSFPCPGLDCGNALEPYVMVINPGSRAEGFIDVEATSSMSENYDSFFAWRDKVRAASGDTSFELNLECDRRFDDLSRAALASATVEGVGFGHRKPGFPCQ